jgi:hypothetical protein
MGTLPSSNSGEYASTSRNAQYQSTPGPYLGYNQSYFDSGFFETKSSNAPSYQPKPVELLDWQDQILRLWSAHNHHVSSDTDIVLFRGILRASEDSIKRRLQELFDNSQAVNETSGYITSNTSYNTTTSQSSQERVNLPAADIGILQPAVSKELAMPNGVAMCSSCDRRRHPFPPKEHIPRSDPIASSGHPGTYRHGKAPCGQKSIASFPTGSYLTVGTDMSMEANSMSLYPTAYHPHPAPTGSSHNHLLSNDVDQPNPLVTYNGGLPPTKALMHLIRDVIRQKKEKGCGLLPGHASQTGAFPCTIGCARRFKSSCDLFRHEEIIHPQQFWFCSLCGDTSAPSERHLFTRDDKMREHIKRYHPFGVNAAQFKVLNVRTSFPERCGLCLHHRHRSWRDRCRHIIMHCKRREDLSMSNRQARGLPVLNGGDDDDDSGDGDDHDDDNDDRHEDEDDSGDFSKDSSWKDASNDRSQDKPEDPFFGGKDDTDDFMGMCHWESPGFWNFPASIKFLPLVSNAGGLSSQSDSTDLTIRWLERVNKKGGTASVFKVSLPIDLETGTRVDKKTYAVKQYPSNMRSPYEHELKVFTALSERKVNSDSFIRCFGTFEYIKPSGQLTFNLILEYGECDLREYFADVTRPVTKDDIRGFWKSLLGITDGLHKLHEIGGVHGDIKPDNIFSIEGTFKLGDFGSTELFDPHNLEPESKQHLRGGTLAYGMYSGFDCFSVLLLTSGQKRQNSCESQLVTSAYLLP